MNTAAEQAFEDFVSREGIVYIDDEMRAIFLAGYSAGMHWIDVGGIDEIPTDIGESILIQLKNRSIFHVGYYLEAWREVGKIPPIAPGIRGSVVAYLIIKPHQIP